MTARLAALELVLTPASASLSVASVIGTACALGSANGVVIFAARAAAGEAVCNGGF